MTVQVYRGDWGRGKIEGWQSKLIGPVRGTDRELRCCLDFFAAQSGVPRTEREGMFVPPMPPPGRPTDMALWDFLTTINDYGGISDTIREGLLLSLGRKMGIEFQFSDGHDPNQGQPQFAGGAGDSTPSPITET